MNPLVWSVADGGSGSQGAQGAQGATGSGSQGATGSQGAAGAQGSAGSQGSQGSQGVTGAQGAGGAQGSAGAQGSTGSQGSAGAQGATGSQGSQGAQGLTGPIAGSDTYVIYNDGGVSGADANLTWDKTNKILTTLNTGVGVTSADGHVLTNTATASSGNQKWSPRLRLSAQGWKTDATAASRGTDWTIENQPVQGAANPTTNLVISSQVNAGGYSAATTLKSTGQLLLGFYGTAAIPALAFNEANGRGIYGANGGLCFTLSTGAVYFAASAGTGGGVEIQTGASYVWSGTSDGSASGQTFLSSPAAATIQQGAPAAASPVAQVLQAQGSRAGTDSNVAGASYTVRPGAGTGNATPGALILQSYVAAASGTGGQTATTTMTLNQGAVIFPNSGGAATIGNATLVSGTVTVNTTAAASNAYVLLTRKTSGGTLGTAITYTISAGTSFTITSDSALDTSTFTWQIFQGA